MDHLNNTEWLLISYSDIKEFQVQNSRNRHISNMAPSPSAGVQNEFTPTPVTPAQRTNNMTTSLNNTPVTTTQGTQHQDVPRVKSIRDSIKMDPNANPEFKEDRQYEHWITSVKAYANLHGTMNVLNPSYIPNDIWKKEEFEQQQAFMWSVVVLKVNSPSGKIYIQNHPGDAQKIFKSTS